MRVLGVETSCDETGIGLFDSERGLVGQALFSQADLHKVYGGVVPEIAARDHVRRLLPLIRETLAETSLAEIDAFAYTAGPGLAGALLTGAVLTHSLAWASNKPAIGIHHLEAHLFSPLLDHASLKPPFIALLVSGGHTQLIRVDALSRYQLLGESRDDAIGEAFDKLAKMMGLGYPGGPAIERLAQKGRSGRLQLPCPMVNRPGLDFSFSGIKTHGARLLQAQKQPIAEQYKADLAYAFQEAVFASLLIKLKRAVEATGIRKIVVAGGVSANRRLQACTDQLRQAGVQVFFPPQALCTDNGAMIAYTACLRLQNKAPADDWPQIRARWPLSDLNLVDQRRAAERPQAWQAENQ